MVNRRRKGRALQGGRSQAKSPDRNDSQLPLADPRWILGVLLSALLAAILCVYCTFCLLIWHGQSQWLFHPSRKITLTPRSAGLAYDDVRFDATETGILQLDGWWIPADPHSQFAGDTILLLHEGSGSLSDSVRQLQQLHSLGINLFAFDYRGFGASGDVIPSEKSSTQDTDAAWRYLIETRHLAPGTIVIDGVKLGASLAAEAALRHPQARGLILENLQPSTIFILQQDPPMRVLPLRLLLHDRFDPTEALAKLAMPKLLLGPGARLYYGRAAEPKTVVILRGNPLYTDANYLPVIRRFLAGRLSGQADP